MPLSGSAGVRARRPERRRPTRDAESGRRRRGRPVARRRRRPGPAGGGQGLSPASRRRWSSSAARRSSAPGSSCDDEATSSDERHGEGAGSDAATTSPARRSGSPTRRPAARVGRDHRPGEGPDPHQRPRGRPVRNRVSASTSREFADEQVNEPRRAPHRRLRRPRRVGRAAVLRRASSPSTATSTWPCCGSRRSSPAPPPTRTTSRAHRGPLGDSDELSRRTTSRSTASRTPAARPLRPSPAASSPARCRTTGSTSSAPSSTPPPASRAGNSGGPAVDESGHVVGIATWATFNDRRRDRVLQDPPDQPGPPGRRRGRGRCKAYRSPWVERGPQVGEDPVLGLRRARATGHRRQGGAGRPAPGASPTTIDVDYKGFPGGTDNTDVMASLYVPDRRRLDPGGVELRRAYPTKLPPKGCMTLTFTEDVAARAPTGYGSASAATCGSSST